MFKILRRHRINNKVALQTKLLRNPTRIFTVPLFSIISFSCLFLLPYYSSRAWASTYYADAAGGNDGNNGSSPSTAWNSIARVNRSIFKPGDQVLFKRGEIWREKLTISSSGLNANPITLGAYGSGINPIINGANEMIGGWRSVSLNVWALPLEAEPSVVYFGGAKGARGSSLLNVNDPNKW